MRACMHADLAHKFESYASFVSFTSSADVRFHTSFRDDSVLLISHTHNHIALIVIISDLVDVLEPNLFTLAFAQMRYDLLILFTFGGVKSMQELHNKQMIQPKCMYYLNLMCDSYMYIYIVYVSGTHITARAI